jgi:hypothetical protein
MELRRPVRRIADDAMQVLLRHDWPGNVRELRNVVRKAALLATDVVTPEHIPALSASAPAPSRAAAEPMGEDLSLREVAELAAGQAEREVTPRARAHPRATRARPRACSDRLHHAPREDEALRHLRAGTPLHAGPRPPDRPPAPPPLWCRSLQSPPPRPPAGHVSSEDRDSLLATGPTLWHCTCSAISAVSYHVTTTEEASHEHSRGHPAVDVRPGSRRPSQPAVEA